MQVSLLRRLAITAAFSAATSAPLAARAEGRVDVSDLDKPEATQRVPSGPVGRKAAQKYMGQKGTDDAASTSRAPAGSGDAHYLALHLGGFVSDNVYKWGGRDSDTNRGNLNIGLTYRLGEWQNSMDLGLRVDYQTFGLADGSANKLSFLPVILFPDASSKFPLYFGVGAGLGVFTKQLPGESPISIDYQLLLGARFFNIANSHAGFFVEGGLKNHFHVFSDGQFNGTFLAVGGVFTF